MFKVLLRHYVRRQFDSKATYIRGYWPEPLTQPTLSEFIRDKPQSRINIGLELHQKQQADSKKEIKASYPTNVSVDQILSALSIDAEVPPLDYDDARIEGQALIDLAIHSGIYRDLFDTYIPDREYIKFTPEQAKKMDKLVPHHWITDQPFARVERNPKKPQPIYYFNPVVGVSAKFINQNNNENQYAHESFYGNIIFASEAAKKPAITLDGKLFLKISENKNIVPESDFDNWAPGQVKVMNFGEKHDKFYSVALVNLDYLHDNSANLHWMISNITTDNPNSVSECDELCDYLPVHGIEGFGYSRYVFLVFQHDSKLDSNKSRIEGFSLESRKFDVKTFLDNHTNTNMVPVGLSWFQTTWDITSNSIFHEYLKLKAPVYDYVQPKLKNPPKANYPGRIPFNILLDHERDSKDINEQVLLERLQNVDPYDYKDQYVPPKVPPTVFEDKDIPSWMVPVMFKKKNKLGYWRGLRPVSATLPLNNNADLDHPIRPIRPSSHSLPEFPNQYRQTTRKKMHKDMPTSKPVNEHEAVYVQEGSERFLGEVKKMVHSFEVSQEKKSNSKERSSKK